MQRKLFFILLAALVMLSNICRAQNEIKPEIINYSNRDYKGEGQNWSITQDENHLLYFANNMGMLVFGGQNWSLYELPKQKIIRSIASDQKGRIYTGAFGEFGYWEKQPFGDYKYHSLNNLIADSIFNEEEIWKIIPRQEDVLFQSFSHIYFYKNNEIRSIAAPGTIMFTFLVRDKYYVDVLGKGVYYIDENYKLAPLSKSDLLNNFKINFILPYANNNLLIGTEKNGIYMFDGNSYSSFRAEDEIYLKTNEINNGIQLSDNLYAIGTISGGLIIIDAFGKTISKINQGNGLQNNTILSLFKDDANNCWLALDRGISQVVLKSDVEYYNDIKGKVGTIYSMTVFQGHIYVASNHGLFRAPFTNLASFDIDSLERFANISNQSWDLKVIDNQLFCGNNSGTLVITGSNYKWLLSSSGGWDLEPVKDNRNILLQGTYNGIAVYKKDKADWYFSNFLAGVGSFPIKMLRIDSSGLIYVIHAYKGVYIIKPSADYSRAVFIRELSRAKGFPAHGRMSFFNYKNQILLNSENGIFKYDFNTDSLIAKNELKQEFQEYFTSKVIINDSAYGYWLIRGTGSVTYKNNKSGAFQFYPFNSKIFSLVSGAENIIPFTNEISFVCGEEGFAVINKNRFSSKSEFPATIITQVFISNKSHYYSLDSNSIENGNQIYLKYSQNSILIKYELPVYFKDVKFSYSLSSNDTDNWGEWTTNSEKEFSNLNPGKYSFKVKSNLSDGYATIIIEVANPWYFSTVAKILYVIMLFAILFLFYKWHKKRLNRQHNTLTLKLEEALLMQMQKNENEILKLKQEQLSSEVVHKSEDLATLAMDLIKKKNVLKRIKEHLDELRTSKNQAVIQAQLQKLSKSLDRHIKDEQNEWHLFDNGFNKVHEEFFAKLLKLFPSLTAQDLRLAAYLKMNLTTKEIAPLLNISTRGVEIKRYRLRKKMNLDEHENLSDFMVKL
ncbi:hypothetical protein [Arachidicoccus sp.]|uniref:helix-turn-helix and ligand-binding sensor domain-containing protein n=1 Tax=Arachidicoccus sp. TaxID=1872624 RepID=UPI003D1E79A5